MTHTNDPNAPSSKEFAEDWLSDYRENSQLNVFESGILNARLVALKVIKTGEVVSKKLFTQRIMGFPLIHNDLCRLYVQLAMPDNNRIFHYFLADPTKLSEDERELALELIVKEFVDFVFCETSLELWPGLNCSSGTIWKKPGNEWLKPNQALMADYRGLDHDAQKHIREELNANEVVDFTYRNNCFSIGEDYQPTVASEVASTANETARTSIGEEFDDVVAEKGIVTNGFAYTVLVKSTELVIAAMQIRLSQQLTRLHG